MRRAGWLRASGLCEADYDDVLYKVIEDKASCCGPEQWEGEVIAV